MAYSSVVQLPSESLSARASAEAPIIIRETFGLNYDPFAPGSPAVLAEPVKATFAQITAELGRGASAIVITGAPGAGKTLLLTLIQDAYGAECSISRIDVAAFLPAAVDGGADLLLLDEADGVNPLTLQAVLSNKRETPRVVVLACRPEAAARLCQELGAATIHLTPLSSVQAKDFIVERVTKAGRADLFVPAALDRLIEAGAGSPQALRALAGMALFLAAYSQTSQIDASHVEEAVRSQGGVLPKDARSDAVVLRREPKSWADNTETIPLQAEPAGEETAVEELLAEEAPGEKPTAEKPTAEEPAVSSSLADIAFQPRPESRTRARAFPLRPALVAAAILLAAVPISASVLFGTEEQRTAPVMLASATPPRITRAPLQTAEDRLRALERVAKATLPGRVLLAIVPQGSLQQVAIGSLEKRAAPVAQPARRNTPTLTAAAATAPLPPSVTSVAGAQTTIATAPVPPPALERVPAPSATLPPRYLNANAMALALVDIAEQAGFEDDDEFVAFRSCVFRRVSPGAAEQAAFWRAVEVCLR